MRPPTLGRMAFTQSAGSDADLVQTHDLTETPRNTVFPALWVSLRPAQVTHTISLPTTTGCGGLPGGTSRSTISHRPSLEVEYHRATRGSRPVSLCGSQATICGGTLGPCKHPAPRRFPSRILAPTDKSRLNPSSFRWLRRVMLPTAAPSRLLTQHPALSKGPLPVRRVFMSV